MECSGGAARRAAVGSKYYANMALAGEKSPFLKDIDKVSAAAAIYSMDHAIPECLFPG
jgi:hypothetical protein